MPNLTTNFLNLVSLASKFSGLGNVKGHLLGAGRELLLALQSLLEVVEKEVSSESDSQQSIQSIASIVAYAQKTIRTAVQQLPKTNNADYLAELARAGIFSKSAKLFILLIPFAP